MSKCMIKAVMSKMITYLKGLMLDSQQLAVNKDLSVQINTAAVSQWQYLPAESSVAIT